MRWLYTESPSVCRQSRLHDCAGSIRERSSCHAKRSCRPAPSSGRVYATPPSNRLCAIDCGMAEGNTNPIIREVFNGFRHRLSFIAHRCYKSIQLIEVYDRKLSVATLAVSAKQRAISLSFSVTSIYRCKADRLLCPEIG
jgi:hypothetical protein